MNINNFPIISLEQLNSHDGRIQEINRLEDACGRYGFFYLSEHGVDGSLVQQAIWTARQFFSLSTDIKAWFGHHHQHVYPRTARGYSPLLGETLHPEHGPDHKEIFDLGVEGGCDKPFSGNTHFPSDELSPQFASIHLHLQSEILNRVIVPLARSLAKILALPEDWVSRNISSPTIIQRLIRYPAGESSAGKHTDNGLFTILIQESLEVNSLEVLIDEKWTAIPSIPNVFVINLGDMFQMISGGDFVSTPHRVVHNQPFDRISLPFFIYPNITAKIHTKSGGVIDVENVMINNYLSIWETQGGAGRALELK